MKTIKNKSRTIQVYNIPCRDGCDGSKDDEGNPLCLCTVVTTTLAVELDDGKYGTKDITRKLAGSLTFLAGEAKDLPNWIAESAPIKQAVAKGTLRLVKE